MILIFFATQWRGVVYDDSYGVPISGASISLQDRHTKRYFAETVTDLNGRWDFNSWGAAVYAGGDYTLEVINGAEKVTIDGDQVYVEVPESRRKVSAPWYRRLWHWPCDETCRWRA